MRIGQLEEALGMTRANIRFYEKEGLLSPARSESGYRDYSPADLETLRRVKLLRQLQFSLEDVKALQSGALDLTAALRTQGALLERRRSDLEAARTLCRSIEETGVAYQGLDAARYLEEMAHLERTGARFQSVEADALPTVSYPWRRFFARSLDFSLCSLILLSFLSLVFRLWPGDGLLWDLVMLYLAWGVLFLLEPLLLSTWGYTPGKRIFGLTVRNAEGEKLTFSQAFARLSGLLQYGEGWAIPFYSLYRNYKCFHICAENEPLPWEEGESYTIRDLRSVRCVGFIAARAAIFLLSFLAGLNVLMPPVRHPLSVAEFARNYNDAALQYDLGDAYRLDEQGQWTETSASYSFQIGGTPIDFLYTLEDGVLTGVSFTTEHAPDYLLYGISAQQLTTVLSMLPAQPDVGFHNWYFTIQELEKKLGSPISDYTFTCHGLTVTNQVILSGYETLDDDFLIPAEGQVQTYRQTFSVQAAPPVTK